MRNDYYQWNSNTPKGAQETDQKLTDNLLLPSLLSPYLLISSEYPPVISQNLKGKVRSEAAVWMDGPVPGTLRQKPSLGTKLHNYIPVEPECAKVISAPWTEAVG